jgi:hypothetical protein
MTIMLNTWAFKNWNCSLVFLVAVLNTLLDWKKDDCKVYEMTVFIEIA